MDKLLVERGLADTRGAAARLVETGRVSVAGLCVGDAWMKVGDSAEIAVAEGQDWVSRGALKLLAALDAFPISPLNRVCVDIGASTGGFTQVLLTHDPGTVVAIDVGRDQFHGSLRADPRVVVREGLDAREARLETPADLLVCDASFISLIKLLPNLLDQAAPGADLIALIKPQFEVGKGGVNKQGVVKSQDRWQVAVDGVRDWMDALPDWRVQALVDSPIHGPNGNREVLMHAKKTA